jgi:hypothetical protein
MNSILGAGNLMRKKIDESVQSETEKIQFEPPKPGLEFMARFEANFDTPVIELGQIESFGKRRIRMAESSHRNRRRDAAA